MQKATGARPGVGADSTVCLTHTYAPTQRYITHTHAHTRAHTRTRNSHVRRPLGFSVVSRVCRALPLRQALCPRLPQTALSFRSSECKAARFAPSRVESHRLGSRRTPVRNCVRLRPTRWWGPRQPLWRGLGRDRSPFLPQGGSEGSSSGPASFPVTTGRLSATPTWVCMLGFCYF